MPLRGRESGRKSGVVTSAKLRRPELNPKDRVAAGKPGPGRTGAPDMSRSRVLLSHPLTHSLTLPTTRHALAEAGHRTSAVFIGAQIWAPASSLDALDAMEWLTTTTTTEPPTTTTTATTAAAGGATPFGFWRALAGWLRASASSFHRLEADQKQNQQRVVTRGQRASCSPCVCLLVGSSHHRKVTCAKHIYLRLQLREMGPPNK